MKSKTSFIFITDCCYRHSINPVTTVPPITVRPLFSRVHGLCFLTFHLIRHAKIFFSSFIQFFDSFVQSKPSTFLTNKILSIALKSVIHVVRFLGRFFKIGLKIGKISDLYRRASIFFHRAKQLTFDFSTRNTRRSKRCCQKSNFVTFLIERSVFRYERC